MEVFSARLKYIRERNGLTQKMMAEQIGMTQSSYSKYEYNLREPNLETLVKIIKVIKESADFLLGVTDFDSSTKLLFEEYQMVFVHAKQLTEELEEIRLDPSGKRIPKHFNANDPESIREYIQRMESYVENQMQKVDVLRSMLLNRLKDVPMVSEDTIRLVKEGDPSW